MAFRARGVYEDSGQGDKFLTKPDLFFSIERLCGGPFIPKLEGFSGIHQLEAVTCFSPQRRMDDISRLWTMPPKVGRLLMMHLYRLYETV